MEEDKVKKYLSAMHRIIRSANPKYMSYVSKEYMKYSKVSPVIAEAIGDMIFQETQKNEDSPYAIFLHDDGKICMDAVSDISKISNVSQFVTQVQELSKYDVDFGEISADDLIIEGDEMAEQIAEELDRDDLTEEEIEKVEEEADDTLLKVGAMAAVGGAAGASARGVFAKLKEKIAGIKNKKQEIQENQEGNEENDGVEPGEKLPPPREDDDFESVCPRVTIDEKKVIENMNERHEENEAEQQKRKNTDTYGDGDPDGDDISLD